VTRNVLLALALAFTALTARVAHAESRVVVRPFYGPQSDAVRKQVEEILERRSNVVVVSSKEADVAAKRLGADANSPEGRKVVAKDLRVSAWVEGIVQKRGKQLRLTVLVYDGANHDRVGRTVMTQRSSAGLMTELKRNFWQKSKTAIARAAAPGESRPTSQDEEDTALAQSSETASDDEEDMSDDSDEDEVAKAAPSDDKVRSTSTSTAFLPSFTPTLESQNEPTHNDGVATEETPKRKKDVLRASIGLGSPYRNLAYNEVVSQDLGDYQLSGAPLVDGRVVFFPAALMTDGWASWLGLDLRAQIAIGIRTVDADGNEFKSSYSNYHLGALGRIPVGKHAVRAFAGYAMQTFTLESKTGNITSPTPNTDYRMLRAGAGGDVQFTDKFAVGLEAAWLQFLSVGQIGEWFPRSSAGGIEVGAELSYAVTPMFYARGFGSYQRVFFDFNAEPGDARVAGGATDNYLTVGLGAGIRL
jgi:hypothetical protein